MIIFSSFGSCIKLMRDTLRDTHRSEIRRAVIWVARRTVSFAPAPRRSTLAHLVIQEYEVHLDEDEGHSRGGRERQHNVVALGVALQLKVLAKFQSGVDHRADTERDGAHS